MLVVHSREDKLIPFAHGRKLYEAANQPKAILPISGGHNEGFSTSGRLYTDGIECFINDYFRH